MKLYRIRTRTLSSASWVGTQKEAKDLSREYGHHDTQWAAVEVPTDKEGLLAFLNEVGAAASRSEMVDLQNFIGREAVEDALAGSPRLAASTGDPAQPIDTSADALADAIAGSKGPAFGHLLEAALVRLGELGDAGWSELSAILKGPASQANEKLGTGGLHKLQRGLRFLALAQIRELGE
jgi:hypothetical protein